MTDVHDRGPERTQPNLSDDRRVQNEHLRQMAEQLVFNELPVRFDASKMSTEAMIHYLRCFISRETHDIAATIYDAPYVRFTLSDHLPAMKLAVVLDHLSQVTSRLDQVGSYAWEDAEPGYELVA